MSEIHENLKTLLSDEKSTLLKDYETNQIGLKDIVKQTGYSKNVIRYVVYEFFKSSVEKRERHKKEMLKECEHYINLGIPIDVFSESIILFQEIKHLNTLRRTILRHIDNGEINPSLPPIALPKFVRLYQRIRVKNAILENEKRSKPLSVKNLSEELGVSYSFASKISQSIDEVPPYKIADGYETVYIQLETLSKIQCDVDNMVSRHRILDRYDIPEKDLLMIEKTFYFVQERLENDETT